MIRNQRNFICWTMFLVLLAGLAIVSCTDLSVVDSVINYKGLLAKASNSIDLDSTSDNLNLIENISISDNIQANRDITSAVCDNNSSTNNPSDVTLPTDSSDIPFYKNPYFIGASIAASAVVVALIIIWYISGSNDLGDDGSDTASIISNASSTVAHSNCSDTDSIINLSHNPDVFVPSISQFRDALENLSVSNFTDYLPLIGNDFDYDRVLIQYIRYHAEVNDLDLHLNLLMDRFGSTILDIFTNEINNRILSSTWIPSDAYPNYFAFYDYIVEKLSHCQT